MQSKSSLAIFAQLPIVLAFGTLVTTALAKECANPLYYGLEGRAVMQFYGGADAAASRGPGIIETASPRHIFRFAIGDDKIELTGVKGAASSIIRNGTHGATGATLYIRTPDLQKTYDEATRGSSQESLRGIKFDDTWKFIACVGRK